MRIRSIFTLVYVCFSTSLFAGTLRDSIGVENLNGKKVIIYKVNPKDTYYSIGRRYNATPRSIMDFNNSKPLHPGDQVKIPTATDFVQPTATSKSKISTFISKLLPSKQQNVIEYKVGPKETLYSIAKRFNTTVDEIKKLNKLTSDSLVVGRIIKIPYGPASPQTPPSQPPVSPAINARSSDTAILDSSGNASDRLKLPAIRYGLREITERGVAAAMRDDGLDNSRMLALHRTAPVGTIIKITNPMTNKTTFAKVVGKITDNETTRDAIIVVNKATADLIGALDQRFQVTLVYGLSNEQ
jgi:LysM repeat protein